MAMISNLNDPNDPQLQSFFGPGFVDMKLREALTMCWAVLPKDQRNIDRLEAEMKRLLDRAIQDLRADDTTFRS